MMAARALNAGGCLFCRRHDGGFRSREHIFSEAYGNHDKILQPGVVCDRCNNGPLSRADKALADFPPIKLLRAERGLPTKAGKPVEATFGNARIAFEAPGVMSVVPNHPRLLRQMPKQADGRLASAGGTLTLTGPRISERTFRDMARAIWKSALELVYLDHGADAAYLSKFDGLRDAVISARPVKGWLACERDATMNDEVNLTYWWDMQINGGEALPVVIDIFGARFWTDALRRDVAPDPTRTPAGATVWVFGPNRDRDLS